MGRTSKALATLALAVLALCGAAAAGADRVLVIGDSLGVGTEPYLDDALGGSPVSTDAKISRTSAEGLEALAASIGPQHTTVVFALGTNDDPGAPELLAEHLSEARSLAGGRCMVVATLARPPLNGVSVEALNEAIAAFASADPNVRVADWAGAVAADPGLLVDGVHADAEGYALRAALLADAIAGCAGATTSPPPGGSRDGFGGDGIPNPDLDALAEGRTRPPLGRGAGAAEPEPLSRRDAFEILADAVSSQIAIGALG